VWDSQKKADPVVFVESEPVKAPSATAQSIREAEKAAATKTVKVKVVAPYRVTHGGKAFVGGDQLTLPADAADHWLKCGWVEPVTAKSKEK
jgi:hypothetical protein